MFNKVYAIPSYKCNLNCPHCEIHKEKAKQNKEKFLEELKKIDSNDIVLFGGEPLLVNSYYLEQILKTGKITSISTNLAVRTKLDLLVKYINKYNISISTSWNPLRFNDKTELDWIYGLYTIHRFTKVKPLVLITLTRDLFTNEKLYDVLDALDGSDDLGSYVSGILFEHYVGPEADDKYNQEADDFLCKIYKEWRWKFNNFIIDRLNNWNCNCGNIATLEPNGNLKAGCPQYQGKYEIRVECLNCSLANICNPCPLQFSCSFPKKLYQLVKEEENGSSTK